MDIDELILEYVEEGLLSGDDVETLMESGIIGDDDGSLYSEGANTELHELSKRLREQKKIISTIKKMYNSGEYDEAKEEISKAIKTLNNLKKAIKDVDETGFSATIGYICHTLSTGLQAWLAGMATFGIGSIAVVATKSAKGGFQFVKQLLEDVKEGRFTWKAFNSYRGQIMTNIDNTIAVLKRIEKECARAAAAVKMGEEPVDESASVNSEVLMEIYESAEAGIITDSEQDMLLDAMLS